MMALLCFLLYIVQVICTKKALAMKTINISDFRANLLKYLEKANSGEQISVTTNGRPIATITPPINKKQEARKQLAQLAKNANIADVVTPTNTEWDANL